MSSVTITVRGTDPTVSIQTEDQDVAGGTVLQLEATSRDSDGTIAMYAWTATAGTFVDPAAEDATWTAPGTTAATQVVTLTLTVTDSDGATASASVTITVPSGPTVSIETVDQTVFGGTVVELEATSADSDGSTVAAYLWTAVLADGSADDSAVGMFDPDDGERRRCDLDGAGCNGGYSGGHPDLDCDRQRTPLSPSPAAIVSRSRSPVPTRRSASRQRTRTSLEARISSLRPRPRIPMARSLRTCGPPFWLTIPRTIPRWERSILSRRTVEEPDLDGAGYNGG